MLTLKKTKTLKKELKLFDVYAIATGTTLSDGLFLLPGLAAIQADQAVVLSYIVAVIPLIPAIFSVIELATAMPRAGGMYYFLDRTLGPAFGTIGGLGTWLTLLLKVAFALIGIGAYLDLFFKDFPIISVAIVLSIILGIINFFGSKKSGGFQIILVIGLLILLIFYSIGGIINIHPGHFKDIFNVQFSSILSTAGLVYISYAGITKVTSLSEEVQNPDRNIPMGMFLSLVTTTLIYIVATVIMVGVLPIEELKGNLTPVATSAKVFYGETGVILLSIAAIMSFISVANAGTLSASRYPLAMSRDHILPKYFRKLSKNRIPVNAIFTTVGLIILVLIFFDPTRIAKLASSFQLLMFALACLAVVVMRESRIQSYDPGYKSPLYPWMQIVGIISPLILIFEMGIVQILITLGLVIVGYLWFKYYAKEKVIRSGAIFHVFERLGQQRYEGLDSELRGILKEKGLRKEDPFDEIVTRSITMDLGKTSEFENVVEDVSKLLSEVIPFNPEEISAQIMEGTRIGATPVTRGVALPHFRTQGINKAVMVLVRSIQGVNIKVYNPLTQQEENTETVNAIFFLISPEENPSQHLRILAQIAGRVDDEDFMQEWHEANNEQELKEALLHNERFLSLIINKNKETSRLSGKTLKEITLPKDSLVALIYRDGSTIIPKGDTILNLNDRLTIIGNPKSISEIRKTFLLE